jgi:hypothetical protein
MVPDIFNLHCGMNFKEPEEVVCSLAGQRSGGTNVRILCISRTALVLVDQVERTDSEKEWGTFVLFLVSPGTSRRKEDRHRETVAAKE